MERRLLKSGLFFFEKNKIIILFQKKFYFRRPKIKT